VGRIFREKWKMQSERHWLTKCTQRYEGKLRYYAFTIMQRESGNVPHTTEKERKLSLILSSESQKF